MLSGRGHPVHGGSSLKHEHRLPLCIEELRLHRAADMLAFLQLAQLELHPVSLLTGTGRNAEWAVQSLAENQPLLIRGGLFFV